MVSAAPIEPTEPLGVIETARLLGVKLKTIHQWYSRGIMPEPDLPSVNGAKAWYRRTIVEWAGECGRIRKTGLNTQEHVDGLAAEYESYTGDPPADPIRWGRPVTIWKSADAADRHIASVIAETDVETEASIAGLEADLYANPDPAGSNREDGGEPEDVAAESVEP